MKKILVIEDDLSMQRAYTIKLTDAGFQLVTAITAQQGFDIAERELPDVIILDVLLPGGTDGFSLLGKLKSNEKTRSIPVIMMTNVEEHLHTSLEAGAVWYFIK